MIIKITTINFIYPTEDTVTNEGNKLNIIVINFHPYLFIWIIFIHLIDIWPEKIVYYFGLWD